MFGRIMAVVVAVIVLLTSVLSGLGLYTLTSRQTAIRQENLRAEARDCVSGEPVFRRQQHLHARHVAVFGQRAEYRGAQAPPLEGGAGVRRVRRVYRDC